MAASDTFYPNLNRSCSEALEKIEAIPAERKVQLQELADYIYTARKEKGQVQLTFICTHNSRRSLMAQLWAAAGAAYFGIDNVHCYSGGTEATAFHPNAIAALERAGFKITKVRLGENPLYEASWQSGKSIEMYSKRFDDSANPSANFAAVMVCSDADRNCPFVPGAAARLALPFEDPKAFDGTPSEATMYDQRSKQIATEMLFVMQEVKNRIIHE